MGIATVLYRWHPNALAAFLDLDAWFSLTWSVTVSTPAASGEKEKTKFEIGRVQNQITFGTLDSTGENWQVMVTYNMVLEGDRRGQWVPNAHESMVGDQDVESEEEVEKLGKEWIEQMLKEKRWETGKGVEHGFWVEYAPMDIFGDGLPMSPHWLYASLDMGVCATCSRKWGGDMKMNRCARCGTAAYCSAECQKTDWKVHKWICRMSLEDRGQVLKITEKGGLIRWDLGRTMVQPGEEVESENPNFAEPQLKRVGASVDIDAVI
jgi:hypothetical protein